MSDYNLIGPFVRRFLLEELIADRNLTPNTQKSYRDTIRLLFGFVADKHSTDPTRVTVEQVDATIVRSLTLFESEKKGRCAECHPSQPGPEQELPLFTDFTYDNLGVPRNPANPYHYLPKLLNPDGTQFVDLGLGGIVKKPEENGKFRVPTLRNVAVTAPYMQNGIFKTLRQVVVFYNTRDVGPWPEPEVPQNVNCEELGNLRLTEQEVDDIVTFLHTLTDGYEPKTVSR